MKPFRPEGPRNAKIVILGEALGEQEEYSGQPFVGGSGQELTRMLAEAGIKREECYITNVLWERPPDNELDYFFATTKTEAKELDWNWHNKKCIAPALESHLFRLDCELSALRPNVTIAFGNIGLWATTGQWGITNWRGSELESPYGKVIPTYHPAHILRNWDLRATTVQDLRRAARESGYAEVRRPAWRFTIRPSFGRAIEEMERLLVRLHAGRTPLSIDIETRAGHIACIGVAWSRTESICLPLMCIERPTGYWTIEEEKAVIFKLYQVLTHKNAFIIGQNHSFDLQYIGYYYGFDYVVDFDTMHAQAIVFPGTPRRLDYISSMYNEHYCFWKEDGKHWNPLMPEEQLWTYNCEDTCRTFEDYEVLDKLISHFNLRAQFEMYLHRVYRTYFGMMLRGIKTNEALRGEMDKELCDAIVQRQAFITKLTNKELNVNSPVQMKNLFYDALGQKRRFHPKTKKVTLNDQALEDIANKEPILMPLCDAIAEERSLKVFLSTFVRAQLDPDGRMRCEYDPTGAETYRSSSRSNVFDRGGPLQNIPMGNRSTTMEMPNVRRRFIPDTDYRICEIDLAGADAQVVAWEADDPILKQMFRDRVKIHAENAKALFGPNAGADGKREPYYTRAKQGVHAVDYYCQPRKLSATLGITVHEAEMFIRKWFQIHPWIYNWHERTREQLLTKREVRNKFGFRRYYFDRLDSVLPEALGWVPQSTVAIVCHEAMCRIDEQIPEIEVLLQVHDSVVFQVKDSEWQRVKPKVKEITVIPVPYDDPLIIPFDLKTSMTTWGDCTGESWN